MSKNFKTNKNEIISIIEINKNSGIKDREICDLLNKENYKTFQNKEFTPTIVNNIYHSFILGKKRGTTPVKINTNSGIKKQYALNFSTSTTKVPEENKPKEPILKSNVSEIPKEIPAFAIQEPEEKLLKAASIIKKYELKISELQKEIEEFKHKLEEIGPEVEHLKKQYENSLFLQLKFKECFKFSERRRILAENVAVEIYKSYNKDNVSEIPIDYIGLVDGIVI